jgi:hypothetical protein
VFNRLLLQLQKRKKNDKLRKLCLTSNELILFIVFSGQISCNLNSIGTNQNPGDKANIILFINQYPANVYDTKYSHQNFITKLEQKISSIFPSIIFILTVQSTNGTTFSVSSQFCSFGQIVSGKLQ